MENKEKVTWGTIFGVASVWFGAHAGGGFASGNQTMNFFVQYGWPAIFTPVIAIAMLALVYRIIIIMCNQHQVSNYSAWSHQLYAPYDKILSPFYEICNLGAGILATSASVAGAAAAIFGRAACENDREGPCSAGEHRGIRRSVDGMYGAGQRKLDDNLSAGTGGRAVPH